MIRLIILFALSRSFFFVMGGSTGTSGTSSFSFETVSLVGETGLGDSSGVPFFSRILFLAALHFSNASLRPGVHSNFRFFFSGLGFSTTVSGLGGTTGTGGALIIYFMSQGYEEVKNNGDEDEMDVPADETKQREVWDPTGYYNYTEPLTENPHSYGETVLLTEDISDKLPGFISKVYAAYATLPVYTAEETQELLHAWHAGNLGFIHERTNFTTNYVQIF